MALVGVRLAAARESEGGEDEKSLDMFICLKEGRYQYGGYMLC